MDETKNGLVALRHALGTLVAPAVSEDDPIASEQLVSAVRYLDFAIERLDHVHQRERFELHHACDLATEVLRACGDDAPPTDLPAVVELGRVTLDDASAGTTTIRKRTAAIRASLRADFVTGSRVSAAAADLVLAAAVRYAAFERSWYAPLGFDTEAGDPAPLTDFLGEAATDVERTGRGS